MTLTLGERLRIRSMVYVAGEPIPFFWPMRSFIHHNPLHALEHMPFEQALARGAKLFHARVYLSRACYQGYLARGLVDRTELEARVDAFIDRHPLPDGLNARAWLMTLLTQRSNPVSLPNLLCSAEDLLAVLAGQAPVAEPFFDDAALREWLTGELLGDRPMCEAIDALEGSEVAARLDELVVRACLDFFDEGQSVWSMPEREQGFFNAWRQLARFNQRHWRHCPEVRLLLDGTDAPEDVIAFAMRTLGVPEERWVGYFTRELARLHGWAGFIRWRANAKGYHWKQLYPGDLVDLLAVRLTLSLGLLRDRHCMDGVAAPYAAVEREIQHRVGGTWLRHEFNTGRVLPEMARAVEMALAQGKNDQIERLARDYFTLRRQRDAQSQIDALVEMAGVAGQEPALRALDAAGLEQLLQALTAFEQHEGLCWLHAMERHAMDRLLKGISLATPEVRDRRPFAQALFCIDTRSERIRRHLEGIGDYQTFGIAGFFGVPVSFMELGKGSEVHLCPVLLKPRNLVLEMATMSTTRDGAFSSLEKALHGVKESVLTPFVTVEAVGLLFGFDMIGKTLLPASYNRWRHQLHDQKPPTQLLVDKLSREQAESIIRTVQRAVIVKALEQELGLAPEGITDDLNRALRDAAMEQTDETARIAIALGLSEAAAEAFIERLRGAYRINPSYAQLQFERLGRIGFTLDEQVQFVRQALRSIGLTSDFSRFVLLVGHGSMSENNPFESALDCGACGGNHGLVNARVLSRMANKPAVRRRLREQGIDIAEDAWFLPAMHNTTTDELTLYDLDLMPPNHLIYMDRLRGGLGAATRLCARERLPELELEYRPRDPSASYQRVQRNALDWSQVRPEWGLSRNSWFIIGRRQLTQHMSLDGRAFMHSYDYRVDKRRRLLENILTGPAVVAQWINMEHYFSTVDNERFGSGSKAYHNVAGRFGVMTGNLSDLRTGLPSQTVLRRGAPYHEPLRLITVIEAPLSHARQAVESVVSVKQLVRNDWIRLLVVDPETGTTHLYGDGEWQDQALPPPILAAAQSESMSR